jgi:hypothetical protein
MLSALFTILAFTATHTIMHARVAYATCTSTWNQSKLDGWYQSQTNTGAASAYIKTQTTTACDGTHPSAYFSMVQQTFNGVAPYAQVGYINNTAGTTFFSEEEESGTCCRDYYWGTPTTGTSYTYLVEVYHSTGVRCSSSTGEADVYVNGSLIVSFCTNWNHGDGSFYSAEQFASDDKLPYQQPFSNLTLCTQLSQGSQCQPDTNASVGTNKNSSPTVANQCFKKLSSNSFETYDARDDSGTCGL